MTFQKIASQIALREGRKSQARIGDIREILKVLVDWEAEILFADPSAEGPIFALASLADKRIEKMRKRK